MRERVKAMNTGQFDQLLTAMVDLAESMGKYRDELVKRGFTREESLQLVVALQTTMITNQNGKG